MPAQLSRANWNAIVSKLCELRWAIQDEGTTSFMEMAFCFKFNGLILVDVEQNPRTYATLVRKAINAANKRTRIQIIPGSIRINCVSNGKTHPAGYVSGAVMEPNLQGLKALACAFVNNHLDHHLSKWEFAFGEL